MKTFVRNKNLFQCQKNYFKEGNVFTQRDVENKQLKEENEELRKESEKLRKENE